MKRFFQWIARLAQSSPTGSFGPEGMHRCECERPRWNGVGGPG